ncbi:MAG: RHS repeat-associated core domain-containing protein, partial [Kiritimatiellae bacterium]|nr:RHS repeat-associated core domain-containing protein [Kiritimatiellia bacterium]
ETMVETSTTSSPAFGTRVSRGVCGLVLEEETADETIAHIYDPHGREERTDRRAHGEADFRTVAEFVYNAMGDIVERRTYTNATDYVTERFAYDHEGREIASTNALGSVVTTSYDPRGNVTAVDGATYPLRMEYDLKGRRTSLKTTRDGESWDETRWALDPATGLCLSKTYADGSTISYTYTPDGLPARTTWPGGRWQENGYNARREVVSTERSDGEETAFAYDAYSCEIVVTNDSASIEFTRDDRGRATNVTTTVAGTTHSLMREFDNAGRLARSGDLFYEYDSEGRLAVVSNSIAAVEYQYAADGLDAGYSLTLHNGSVFARSVARDAMRRSLVTGITSSMNNNPVESIAYSYDALGRPTNRNNDAFGYNERGEVTSASIMGWSPSPSTASYGYDDIGNLQLSSFNAATNAYTANGLNQYTSILCDSVTLCEPTYDTDGNMLSDGVLSFTYDAASRLKTVSSNGVTLVTNFYDAKSRRVKKVTPNATTTFFYDDWNLVEERIAYADNTTSTIRYYWGDDLSGTLQGAGGVGGLLWLTVDGTIYIPCYDSNGNVTRYLSVNGGALARYSYDAFGKLIAKSGRRASFFRHRFSTKYFDTETGLYYYGYRFYHPGLMRWLNRDPMGEEGGINLYVPCGNDVFGKFDYLGLSWLILRSGDTFAYAVPTAPDDTFSGLAEVVQLDESDCQKWAHTTDELPIKCKWYLIPNTKVYHKGVRRFYENWSNSVIGNWDRQNAQQMSQDKNDGFNVVLKDNITDVDVRSALGADGLYEYVFTGHGSGGGDIVTEDFDSFFSPSRITLYGIHRLTMQGCDTANDVIINGTVNLAGWSANVAVAGRFVGYLGAVNIFSASGNMIIRAGTNSGDILTTRNMHGGKEK